MKTDDSERHPGPWRMVRIESESAGIIIAVGFIVLGVVGLPIGKWFLLAAALLGLVIALILRLLRRRPPKPQPHIT